MKNHNLSLTLSIAALIMIAGATGCAGNITQAEEEEDIGTAESALETDNALNPNALSPNALNPNALNPNALNPNALNPGALSAIQDPGLAGSLSRQHLKYTVGCALDDSQSFSFSWTDSSNVIRNEIYWGSLGLWSSWATSPLSTMGQRWISACLAARTNYYGIPVTISSRGPTKALNKRNTPEASTYTMEEGAFWGNIYTSTPAVYSCNVAANDANSRAQLRDCAAGHVDPSTGLVSSCGAIQRLGSCDTYCAPLSTQGVGHLSCWSDLSSVSATTNQQPITVVLQ